VRQRKTDYGTIILHWLLVAAILVAFVTGLRIATESPDRAWLNWIDVVLPRANVWVPHMEAAIVLTAVSIAYAIYLIRAGLTRRIVLDKIRLKGLVGRKQAKFGSLSVLLIWTFFATMLALIVSGGLLYFGLSGGYGMKMVHWYATWVIPFFATLHVLVHYAIGRSSQLLRVFRPDRVPPPPPRLDAVELLTMLVEKSPEFQSTSKAPLQPDQPHEAAQDRREAQRRTQPRPTQQSPTQQRPTQQSPTQQRPTQPGPTQPGPAQQRPTQQNASPQGPAQQGPTTQRSSTPRRTTKPRNMTLQANPFVVAAAVAITGAWAVVAADWLVEDHMVIQRIAATNAPVLDGDTSDPVWRNVQPFSVMTNDGDNFDGKGESKIDIRAVHDGTWAYFLFTWEDPTRSLKQLPLIKQTDGWHMLHDGYENGDEHAFNEDKFSVLFTTLDVHLAGDRTFHASPQPIANAPATMTGRGLHYTAAEGVYADVWQWKATSGGPTGWMDDDHFGPPLEPTPQQVNHTEPYRGGFAPDPGSSNYSDNFVFSLDAASGSRIVTPRRLPKNLAATVAAMGQITLDPNVGESDGARWFMTEAESDPYTPERDRQIPVGTVLPGVIIAGEFTGDRADVRCAARWASGHWALEVARRLDVQSQYDVPLKTGVFMRVSAFDHSQIRHTRHVRPIRLEVE
jgi:ethylbenzene dehydrogenase/cytochrome b561-like protein